MCPHQMRPNQCTVGLRAGCSVRFSRRFPRKHAGPRRRAGQAVLLVRTVGGGADLHRSRRMTHLSGGPPALLVAGRSTDWELLLRHSALSRASSLLCNCVHSDRNDDGAALFWVVNPIEKGRFVFSRRVHLGKEPLISIHRSVLRRSGTSFIYAMYVG